MKHEDGDSSDAATRHTQTAAEEATEAAARVWLKAPDDARQGDGAADVAATKESVALRVSVSHTHK